EVEFEHEGHLYLVRRTITGVNHTVKAEAHWNHQQVAEGVRDVATYLQSVLGMDDTSFRASVFAEQKQIAAFSAHGPQKRRDLVLRLLGITPLDKARDSARSDAREARADHERLAGRLPDLPALEEACASAQAAAQTVTEELAAAEVAVAAATDAADAPAQAAIEALPVVDEPIPPDPAPSAAAKAAAEQAAATANELAGAVRAAEQELARAEAAASRSAELSADEDCPVCGQSLGDAFAQVVSHRAAEVDAARSRLAELQQQVAAATKARKAAAKDADAATKALATAQQAWSAWEHHAARRAEADAALATALAHPFFVALRPPADHNA